jgi:hypothetical protein
MEPMPERARAARQWTALVLLALCAGTVVLRAWVIAPREHVGHGDIAHYTGLARGIVEGTGLWVNYVSWWLDDPAGIPASGVAFWKPLPALIGALGMLALGEQTLRAASLGMITVTCVAPLVGYLLGRDVLAPQPPRGTEAERRRVGLVAAGLLAGLPAYLYVAAVPLTFGPSLVLGGLCIWTTARAAREPRLAAAAGLLVGLSLWNRSDAILWIPALLALPYSTRGAVRARHLGVALLACAVACVPYLVWESRYGGSPGVALARAATIRDYGELYALPQTLGLAHLLEPGPGALVAPRLGAAARLLLYLVTLPATAGGSVDMNRTLAVFSGGHAGYLPLLALCALAWIGARSLVERAMLPAGLALLAAFVVYAVVYPHSSQPSFRAFAFGFLPLALASAARALVGLSRRVVGPRLQVAALVAVVLLLCVAGTRVARERAVRLGEVGEGYARGHAALLRWFLDRGGPPPGPLLVPPSMVHELHFNTRLPIASLPFGPEDQVLAAGLRLGATHVLLPVPPPEGHAWALRSERLRPVERTSVPGLGELLFIRIQ